MPASFISFCRRLSSSSSWPPSDGGPAIEYLPLLVPALIALVLFTSALGILLSAINVKLRDIQHLLDIGLTVWFWATPIVYQFRLVRDRALNPNSVFHILFIVYRLNPITPIVLTFQRASVWRHLAEGCRRSPRPDPAGPCRPLVVPLAAADVVIGLSLVLLFFAMNVFGRLEGNFAEEL